MEKKKPPQTSIDAFHSLKDCEIKETYQGIINALCVIKEGTFEDIAKAMKTKPDRVWKRLSELEFKYMILYRPGAKKVLKSGRQGYVWMLTDLGKGYGTTTEKALPGKTISDFSKAILNQPKLNNNNVNRLF